MKLDLEGKRALVTGSSSGIGSAIAKMLAAEGVSVVVHGRNSERTHAVSAEILAAGGRAFPVIGDLETDSGADAVAARAREALGGVDILVNNAGGRATGGAKVGLFQLSVSEWLQTLVTTLASPYSDFITGANIRVDGGAAPAIN